MPARPAVLVLAALAVVPALGMLVVMLPSHVQTFTDPCTTFGGGAGSSTMSPGDRCADGATIVSGSRATHLAILAWIDGGLLLGLGLAVAAVLRQHAGFAAAGALALLLAAFPMTIGFAGYVVYPSVIGLVLLARALPRYEGWARALARAIAVLLLIGTLGLLVGALGAGALQVGALAALLFALAAGALVAAWWPVGRAATLTA